jgi:hypothetical protein
MSYSILVKIKAIIVLWVQEEEESTEREEMIFHISHAMI